MVVSQTYYKAFRSLTEDADMHYDTEMSEYAVERKVKASAPMKTCKSPLAHTGNPTARGLSPNCNVLELDRLDTIGDEVGVAVTKIVSITNCI